MMGDMQQSEPFPFVLLLFDHLLWRAVLRAWPALLPLSQRGADETGL